MAHSVCPDDQAQRGEKGLYGTLCVSGRPSAALGGRTIWHTLCVRTTKRSVGRKDYMAHSVCVSHSRATGGLPLDRSRGTPLTRAENLHGVRRFLP